MAAKRPCTYGELFKFYHEYVKPLYSAVQVENILPNEVLFEINAAFDHLSRAWVYQEQEAHAVEKSYSHLKRACLDIFKLKVKDAVDQYKSLKKLNTLYIDNGEFDSRLNELHIKIRNGAIEARKKEGDTRDDEQAIAAFAYWQPVYVDCVKMETDFHNNKNVDWSHRLKKYEETKQKWIERVWGFIIGLLTGLLVWWMTERAGWLRKSEAPQIPPAANVSNAIGPSAAVDGTITSPNTMSH